MQRKRKAAKHTHHCQEYLLYGLQKKKPRKKHPLFWSNWSFAKHLPTNTSSLSPQPLNDLAPRRLLPGLTPATLQDSFYPRDLLWVQHPCACTGLAQGTLHDETQWIFILNYLCFMLPREVSFKQECGLPGLSRRFSACSATSVQVVGCSQLAPALESQRSTSLPNSCSRLHLGSLK